MKRVLISFALLVLAFNVSTFAQTQPKSRVDTVQFQSKLVGVSLPYNVILPADYDKAKTTRYPVLYLLHGLFGHYDNWIAKTQLKDTAEQYQIIIVTPEGNNAWYTDSATVPGDKYESYIIQELIPEVQQRYRTIETRAGRAVAGLSMGGYGALKFGVKHPELFAFVASMSGALGAATWTETELPGLEAIWRTLAPVYGPPDSPVRAANDVAKLYRDLSPAGVTALPYIYLDCGTEDSLLQSNRSFADILLAKKIPHEYRELPGAHTWPYWNQQVAEVLRIAATKLSPPQPSMTTPGDIKICGHQRTALFNFNCYLRIN
ncbi:MAG: esterase family protein [Acidobacteriota bacterium]|nr:esterase family protein [Acidobacteriota bacterium]